MTDLTPLDIPDLFDRGFANVAIDSNAESPLRIYCFGCVLASEEKWIDALEVFRALERKEWRLDYTRYAIGVCFAKCGQLENALAHFNRSLGAKTTHAAMIAKHRTLSRIHGSNPTPDARKEIEALEVELRRMKTVHLIDQGEGTSHGFTAYYSEPEVVDNYLKPYLDYVSEGDSVLDIGCNVGSKLDGFYRMGCRGNGGLEINAEAIKALQEKYPEMHADMTVYLGDADEELKKIEPYSYDIIHLHYASSGIFYPESIAKFFKIARKTVIFCDGAERNPAILHGGFFFHDIEELSKGSGFEIAQKHQNHADPRWDRLGTRWIFVKS